MQFENDFPFDMDTHDGKCYFVWHVLDKLGVIDELFCCKYLQKCGFDWKNLESSGLELINSIIRYTFSTEHILYILDKIDLMGEKQFKKDLNEAEQVVMHA